MYRIATALLTLIILGPAFLSAKELKYTLVSHFFEENPGGKPLGPCHGGVVIDKAGNFYVTTDAERGIVVFSPDGKYLRAVGPHHVHGLEIRKEGGAEYIYGARPESHEVVKLKLDGEQIWAIGAPKVSNISIKADRFKPFGLTVAADGSMFV